MSNSGKDFIPRPDGDFSAWGNHFYVAVKNWFIEQGLDDSALDALAAALAAWNTAYPAHITAQAAAEAASQTKAEARAQFESAIRPIARFVQAYPKTTDNDRATVGITVRGSGTTTLRVVTTRPIVAVSMPQRLQHTLRLVDEATPTRRARPRAADAAEVYVTLTPPGTPPPVDFSSYRYAGSSSRGGFTLSFRAAEGGKTAHYLVRWTTLGGEAGPWSEGVSATVAA